MWILSLVSFFPHNTSRKKTRWFIIKLFISLLENVEFPNIFIKTVWIYAFETGLEKRLRNQAGSQIGLLFVNTETRLTTWKKHAIANYYDNIDSFLRDANKNNQKLYWKLLKDTFHTFNQINTPAIRALTRLHFEI